MLHRTIFTTRALSDELCSWCAGFRPASMVHYALKGLSAEVYLYALLSLDADWVVNIDEDAFLMNPEALCDLQVYMHDNGYHCCGMPDGGTIPIRHHNPMVPNPFFNILHTAALREAFSFEAANEASWSDDLKTLLPKALMHVDNCTFDAFEPYYPFFFWMLRRGYRILYLDAWQWPEDNLSTILRDHLGRDLLIHCWYAREFEQQRERFERARAYCAAERQRKSH